MYRHGSSCAAPGAPRPVGLCLPRKIDHCFTHQLTSLHQPQFIYPCVSLKGLSRQQQTQARALTYAHHHETSPDRSEVYTPPPRTSKGNAKQSVPPPPTTYFTAKGRIVAIGDIHGDIEKAIAALEVAGVLTLDDDGLPVWRGGNTVAVQLGDVLDRGDTEIGVVMLLRELDRQARAEGGALFMLNGNHESLNVCGDFRYATPGGIREAAVAAGLTGSDLEEASQRLKARSKMYRPGGQMAVELSKNPTVLIVNNTVFAHGGVTPTHVKYGLERLNLEVAAWMRGDRGPDGEKAPPPFLAMGDAGSVMWNRQYGKERFVNPYERYSSCKTLQDTLNMLDAQHLVVGHTIQMSGANCECNGKVWRMDVGMSSGILDAVPQVLEISPVNENGHSEVRLLTADVSRQEERASALRALRVDLLVGSFSEVLRAPQQSERAQSMGSSKEHRMGGMPVPVA